MEEIEKKEVTEEVPEENGEASPKFDIEALRPLLVELIKKESQLIFSELMLSKPVEETEEIEEESEEEEYNEF